MFPEPLPYARPVLNSFIEVFSFILILCRKMWRLSKVRNFQKLSVVSVEKQDGSLPLSEVH